MNEHSRILSTLSEDWFDTDKSFRGKRGWQTPPYYEEAEEEKENQPEEYPGYGNWMQFWPSTIEDILEYYRSNAAGGYTFVSQDKDSLLIFLPAQGAIAKTRKGEGSEWHIVLWYPVDETFIERRFLGETTNEEYLFICQVYLSENPSPHVTATFRHSYEEDILPSVLDQRRTSGQNFIYALLGLVQGKGTPSPYYTIECSFT